VSRASLQRWRRRALGGALLALAIAGCGSAATSAGGSPQPTPNAPGPVLSATLSLSGAANLSYAYAVRRAGYRSCADVAALRPAAGDVPRDFALPVPPGRPTVDGHLLTVAAVIALYHGPAHYATSDIGDDDTLIALDDPRMAFEFGSSARADGEVQPDGSGKMALTGMTNPANQELAATITWTCAPAS
jgi:hypothetical protein